METINAIHGKRKYLNIENLVYLLLLALSMIPGYLLARYGIEFSDEPYQIMNSMDINRSPMFPLSSLFGGFLGYFTDFRWLPFRYLAVSLNNLAIIVCGIYLFHRSKSISITAITVSVAILFSGLSRSYHNLYGWDSWTSFFLTLTLVALLFFIERRSVGCFILLCFLSVLTAMVRIPSAIIIPIVWFVILISTLQVTKINISGYYPWLYLLVCGIFILIIIMSIYGSLYSYVQIFQNNLLSDHSAVGLLAQLVYDAVRYSFSILAFGMLAIILDNVRDKNIKIPYRKFFIIVASAAAVFFQLLMVHYHWDLVNETIIDNYWIFLALFFIIWQFFRMKDREGMILAFSILLSGFVCLIGSNVGLRKYPSYIFIPLTTALLLKLCTVKKIKYFSLIAAVPLFIMEVGIAIPQRYYVFYGEGLAKSHTFIDKGRAKGIFTTADRARVVEEILQFNDSIAPEYTKIVVAENRNRHVYLFLFDCLDSFAPHNWVDDNMLDSPDHIEWLKTRLDKADNPMVIYVKRYDSSSTKMKVFLDRNMKVVSDKETFMVYMPESE